MATITVNIDEEINRTFRTVVERRLGKGKGTLGKAITEALKQWVEEEEQRQIGRRQIALLKKGIGTLGGWKFKREELYGRRF